MPRVKRDFAYSIGQLKGLLREQLDKLNSLRRQRRSLAKELRGLDRQIGQLMGGRTKPTAQTNTAEKSPKAPKPARRRKLPKNDRPLYDYILEILGESKKGLSPTEVRDKVLAAGYKTYSSNFYNVVYMNLDKLLKSKKVQRDDGIFRLAD